MNYNVIIIFVTSQNSVVSKFWGYVHENFSLHSFDSIYYFIHSYQLICKLRTYNMLISRMHERFNKIKVM